MFTDLKSYPEYTRIEDDGLTTLPAHWGVNRLGQIGTFLKGNGGSREDDVESGVPCVRYGDLYKYYNVFVRRGHSFVSEEQAANYTRPPPTHLRVHSQAQSAPGDAALSSKPWHGVPATNASTGAFSRAERTRRCVGGHTPSTWRPALCSPESRWPRLASQP